VELLQSKIIEAVGRDAICKFADVLKAVTTYAGKEYKQRSDAKHIMMKFVAAYLEIPTDPGPNSDRMEALFIQYMKELSKRKNIYNDYKTSLKQAQEL
jgi:hypothetical protein